MAVRAIRNTYGYADVGYGVERRLLIIAGQVVPPHLRLEDPTAVIDELGPNNPFGYLYSSVPPDEPTPTVQAEPARVVKNRAAGRRMDAGDA
jgi:hypothetical protein